MFEPNGETYLIRTRLTIKIHRAKLKMMKHKRAEYLNDNYLEDTETSRTSSIPNFTPHILPKVQSIKVQKYKSSKQIFINGRMIL